MWKKHRMTDTVSVVAMMIRGSAYCLVTGLWSRFHFQTTKYCNNFVAQKFSSKLKYRHNPMNHTHRDADKLPAACSLVATQCKSGVSFRSLLDFTTSWLGRQPGRIPTHPPQFLEDSLLGMPCNKTHYHIVCFFTDRASEIHMLLPL